MKNTFKGKFGTTLVVLATIILAGVAIYTAIRLYQLRQQPVAPNVPSSIPQAAANVGSCSALAFTLASGSPSPSPSGSPTASPSPTPTGSATPTTSPTPAPSGAPNTCGGTCGSNSNCASGLICYNGLCRNPSCTSSTNCVCGTSAPTPTPPTLPKSGTDWPTVAGIGVGVFAVISSILLAI